MSYILKRVNKALSDADLRTILGDDLKIIKYSELDSYSDLDELLPNELDYCIVLYEEKLNSGHWVCLCKYGGVIELFDPYGFKPDRPLKWISMKKRRMLDQDTPDLTHLLGRERYLQRNQVSRSRRLREYMWVALLSSNLSIEKRRDDSGAISRFYEIDQAAIRHWL